MKKIFAIMVLCLTVTSLVVAGGAGDSKSPAPGSKTELTLWIGSWWEPSAAAIKQNFEAAFPQYTLNVDCLPINGYFDNAVMAILSGSPPDILDLDVAQISTFASRDLLIDITDSVGNKLKPSDFAKPSWDGSMYNGKLYGMPSRAFGLIYYYNKNMFDEAGVAYPSDNWTVADFLEISKKITVPGKKYGAGISADASDPSNVFSSFAPFLWSMGGDFLSPDNKRCVLNSKEAVAAITFWTELYTKHKVVPEGSLSYTVSRDVVPLFDQNQVAMLPFNIQGAETFNKNPNLRWDLVPCPGGTGRAGGWTLTIPTSAAHPKEAQDYLLWFARPDVQAKVCIVEPSNKAAWDLTAPWNSAQYKKVLKAADTGRLFPTVASWGEIQKIIITELQLILQQRKTPQQGADAMVAQVNALL
jgi:multiple sugar transport system substrate-binding protein